MTLRDWLPSSISDFDSVEKFLDAEILQEFDARETPWPGPHKNVTYWAIIEKNGKEWAIGLNENPSRGISLPIIRFIP